MVLYRSASYSLIVSLQLIVLQLGSCGKVNVDTDYIVALSPFDYKATRCGRKIRIQCQPSHGALSSRYFLTDPPCKYRQGKVSRCTDSRSLSDMSALRHRPLRRGIQITRTTRHRGHFSRLDFSLITPILAHSRTPGRLRRRFSIERVAPCTGKGRPMHVHKRQQY